MRGLLLGLITALILTAGTLPAAKPASANGVGLWGGVGCYGIGESFVVSATYTYATTTGCSGSNRYLSATVYPYPSGDPGTCHKGWGIQDWLCRHYYPVASVWADHNLCYSACNGYVQTYDYW